MAKNGNQGTGGAQSPVASSNQAGSDQQAGNNPNDQATVNAGAPVAGITSDADKQAIASEAARLAAESIAAAEAAKNPQPGPGVQAAINAARQAPKNAAQLAATEETVTMVFPRKVLLTLNDHSRVEFEAGIQEVPKSLAGHDYLAMSGVKPYVKQ